MNLRPKSKTWNYKNSRVNTVKKSLYLGLGRVIRYNINSTIHKRKNEQTGFY